MASIRPYKNKAGKVVSFQFRTCTGRDAMGKQQFATTSVKVSGEYATLTPKKLEKAMQLSADEWERGIQTGSVPMQKQTFKYFVEEVWLPLQVKDGQHRPNTIDYYEGAAKPLIKAFGSKNMVNITAVDIQKYLKGLSAETTSATVCRNYRVLKMIFRYAARVDIVPHNVMEKVSAPLKQGNSRIEFLSKDDAHAFLIALDEYADPLWSTMMKLLISTGLRRGEALGLQWQDISLKNGTLTVTRNVTMSKSGIQIGEPKTAQSCRTLPLAIGMLSILSEWRRVQAERYGVLLPTAFVFSSIENPYQPLTPHAVTRWLWKFSREHKLPDMHPHMLRHTAATLMLESGASVKEVQNTLGHTNASTTLNFYIGTSPEALRNAANGLADVLNL